MKMRAVFESTATPHAYFLAASLPNMRLSDLSVTVGPGGQTLTIKGFRGPTQDEVGGLLRMALMAGGEGRGGGVRLEDLLAAGAERFGSFVETVRLPEDAREEGVEATYEKGVLRVVIPRVAPPPPPLPPSHRRRLVPPSHPVYLPQRPMYYPPPMGGGGGYRYGGPGRGRGGLTPGGFWGDQDVWW